MITTIDGDIGSQAIVQRYWYELATMAISDEVKKKMYEIADKIADEIMDKYELKQYLYKGADKLTNRKGDLIITVVLSPKKK